MERDVVQMCRDEAALATTELVQPALFACDVAAFRVLEAEGATFSAAAGHSLGEFVALVATGACDMAPVLEVVRIRGRAMQEASDRVPGTMTALIGLTPEEAAEVCEIAGRGDVLEVANENAPKQVVLSGSVPAIERAEEVARGRNAKAVRLKVAGAFHSPLMKSAQAPVREAISELKIRTPMFPVVPNASGKPTSEPSALRDLLSRHVISSVRWDRSLRAMSGIGVTSFVEAGPGDVLAKLAKRCVNGAEAVSVGGPEEAISFAKSHQS
jgi:[acyl-carrier-protein] S-malonyltransferase